MDSSSQTTIVVAHRLSTIRNASRICVIFDGRVREIGTHEELMANPNGHYRRLQAFQDLHGSGIEGLIIPTEAVARKNHDRHHAKENDEGCDIVDVIDKETEKINAHRARTWAWEDRKFLVIGGFGAILAG